MSYSILALFLVGVLAFLPFQIISSNKSVNYAENYTLEYEKNKNLIGVEALFEETLYFNAGEKLMIKSVKLGKIDCGVNGEYFGMSKINISRCLSKNRETSPDIFVDTNKGKFKSETFIEKNLYTSFEFEE